VENPKVVYIVECRQSKKMGWAPLDDIFKMTRQAARELVRSEREADGDEEAWEYRIVRYRRANQAR